MQDTIIEDILRAPALRERTRTRPRIETVIPPANRYPRSIKRAELEKNRQPWSQNAARSGYSNARFL
ncbi:MAG TPA: hypothetical protein VGM92_03695 [Candidatus Kapabacteria bacterium]